MAPENEVRLPQRYRAKRPHHPLRSIHSQVFDQTPQYYQARVPQLVPFGSEQSHTSKTTGDPSIFSQLTSLRSSVSSPYTLSPVSTPAFPYYCHHIPTTSNASPEVNTVPIVSRGHTYEVRTHKQLEPIGRRERRYSYAPPGSRSKMPIPPTNTVLLTPENPDAKRYRKDSSAWAPRLSQDSIDQSRNARQTVRPPLRKLPAIDDRSTLPSQQLQSPLGHSLGKSRVTPRESITHCEGLGKDCAGQETACEGTPLSPPSVNSQRQTAARKVTSPNSPSKKRGHRRSRTARNGTEMDMTVFAESRSPLGIPTEYKGTWAEKEPDQKSSDHETKASSIHQSQNSRSHLSVTLEDSQLFKRRRARSLSLNPARTLNTETALQYEPDALSALCGTSAADIETGDENIARNDKRMVHFRSYASINTVHTYHYQNESDSSSLSIDLGKADLPTSQASERAVMTGAVDDPVLGLMPPFPMLPDSEEFIHSVYASDAKVEQPSDTELDEALRLARSRSTQFSPNEGARNVRASQSYFENVKRKRERRTKATAQHQKLRRSQFNELLNHHWAGPPVDLADSLDQPSDKLSDEAVGELDRSFMFPDRELDGQRPSTPDPYSSRPFLLALPESKSAPVLGAKHSHERGKASLSSIKGFLSIKRKSKQDQGSQGRDKDVVKVGTLQRRARSVSKKLGGIWKEIVGQGARKVE